jgi:hypothetical protein
MMVHNHQNQNQLLDQIINLMLMPRVAQLQKKAMLHLQNPIREAMIKMKFSPTVKVKMDHPREERRRLPVVVKAMLLNHLKQALCRRHQLLLVDWRK